MATCESNKGSKVNHYNSCPQYAPTPDQTPLYDLLVHSLLLHKSDPFSVERSLQTSNSKLSCHSEPDTPEFTLLNLWPTFRTLLLGKCLTFPFKGHQLPLVSSRPVEILHHSMANHFCKFISVSFYYWMSLYYPIYTNVVLLDSQNSCAFYNK